VFVPPLELRRVSRAAAWCPVALGVAITSHTNLMVRYAHDAKVRGTRD
jgi:cyanophycinase-like exopeptidase